MRTAGFITRTILRGVAAAFIAFASLPVSPVHAAGTAAGTMITSQATVQYTLNAITYTQNSNVNTVRVDTVVNNTTTWQNIPPGVSVSAGQANAVLTMTLANTGNTADSYTLSFATNASGTYFDPAPVTIYLDSNGNGTYDAGTDQQYVQGTNDPTLAADAARNIFVLGTVPAAAATGQQGWVALTATSKTATGAGTVINGGGPGGTNIVVGLTGGISSAPGFYIVSNVIVTVAKSAVVTDPLGGSRPMTGSTIRYTLSVTASGSGTATGVVITDPIPANTTYRANTLRLNALPLGDGDFAADGDAGEVSGGTVTVRLGNMTSATPAQTITFDVTIN